MTANLPTGRWREPRDVSVVLEVPPAGVFLGMDAESAPVLLPAIGPRLTRVGWSATGASPRCSPTGCSASDAC